MALELYKYKLNIHERKALPKDYNTSVEGIKANFDDTRKTIRETLASFLEEDIRKIEKQLEELTKPMLDAVKLPQLGHLYYFLTKNSADINKYNEVVRDACKKILREKYPGEELNKFFKNVPTDKHIVPDVLLMAGDSPETCFVFPNIKIDKYPIPSAIGALTDTHGTIDSFKAEMEADLAHPQRKAKWATDEVTHKQLFRKEEMSLPRALRRFVVTEAVADDVIRDIDKAVQRDRSAPELLWAKHPADFLEMYDIKGPSSCMTTHNNEGDYGILAAADLHPTSLYGMMKKDGEPIAAGVYIRHNGRTIARAVVWKHPSWKKWVTYRTYPDLGNGVEGKYFQALLNEHGIIYYPNDGSTQYRLSYTNLFAEFEIKFAKNEKNILNSIVPYPYFDGDPAGVNRYAKWDHKEKKLMGVLAAGTGINSVPAGYVNMSGSNSHCIKLSTFVSLECNICNKTIDKSRHQPIPDKVGNNYHEQCVRKMADYSLLYDHNLSWLVIHKDDPDYAKVYHVKQTSGGVFTGNIDSSYPSRKVAALHMAPLVRYDDIMDNTVQLIDDLDNEVIPIVAEMHWETFNVKLKYKNNIVWAKIPMGEWDKLDKKYRSQADNWSIYLDRVLEDKTKSGLKITVKTQHNVDISSSGFFEPIYEDAAA